MNTNRLYCQLGLIFLITSLCTNQIYAIDFLEPPPSQSLKVQYTEPSPETPVTNLDQQQQAGLIRSLQQSIHILNQNRPYSITKLTELLQPSKLLYQPFGNKKEEYGFILLNFANKANTIELYKMKINGSVAGDIFLGIDTIDFYVPNMITTNFKGDVFLENLGLMPTHFTLDSDVMGPNLYSSFLEQRPPLSHNQKFQYLSANSRIKVTAIMNVKTQQDMLMAPKNISFISLLKRNFN